MQPRCSSCVIGVSDWRLFTSFLGRLFPLTGRTGKSGRSGYGVAQQQTRSRSKSNLTKASLLQLEGGNHSLQWLWMDDRRLIVEGGKCQPTTEKVQFNGRDENEQSWAGAVMGESSNQKRRMQRGGWGWPSQNAIKPQCDRDHADASHSDWGCEGVGRIQSLCACNRCYGMGLWPMICKSKISTLDDR